MEHDIELCVQLWKELKPHLIGGDIEEAADTFVHVLMEHGIEASALAEFALDRELKDALRDFAEEEIFEEEEYDDDDELDFDEDEYGYEER